MDDYSITIGSGACTDIAVFTNLLSCYPPRKEPPKFMNTSNDDGHGVDVSALLVRETPRVMIASYELANRRFGAKCSIVGRCHCLNYGQFASSCLL